MRIALPVALLAGVFVFGCTSSPGDGPTETTGAALSVDYFGDTDVVGFHFMIERVECYPGEAFDASVLDVNVDLVDGIFPGMVELVEEHLDPDSKHLGADLFVTLEPGCYDVTATPAAEIDGDDWTPSADCGTAMAEGVEVFAGATTEATLISQCVGDENGALDTLVLLNHPPMLSVEIDEKFNYECEAVEVCVTGYDPDDDPVEFDWMQVAGPGYFSLTPGPAEVIGYDDGHRIWQQCAEIVTRWTDSYDFSVTLYDLGYVGGVLTRIEDMVDGDSHASMTFPIHTNWIEEPMCFDETGALVLALGVEIERAPGCSYTTAEYFYCNAGNAYGVDEVIRTYLCDGTDLLEEALYPACD
jgi:hypothetical protein